MNMKPESKSPLENIVWEGIQVKVENTVYLFGIEKDMECYVEKTQQNLQLE